MNMVQLAKKTQLDLFIIMKTGTDFMHLDSDYKSNYMGFIV
ncbi:MAG: hypothetical protein RSF81_02870 [Oscillospiraceae bacterium]